jgi:hypothetical protein
MSGHGKLLYTQRKSEYLAVMEKNEKREREREEEKRVAKES